MSAEATSTKPLRCAACQLQLCKSRYEQPHTALREVTRESRSIGYLCQTCGVTLTCTLDLTEPGWQSQRR